MSASGHRIPLGYAIPSAKKTLETRRRSYNIPARPNGVIRLEARALDKFIRREGLFVVHDNVIIPF
jgi:hypothetical protein